MKKITIFNWSPFFLGLILLVVAKIDMLLFDPYSGDVRALLDRELPIVILGVVLSVVVFSSSFYWLYKKEGRLAFQAIISPVLFFMCMSLGGAMGAAYLNAT